MPFQLHVYIVMKMDTGVRRPSVSERFAVGAVNGKVGKRQQLPLLDGEPKHEGVRSEPVKDFVT